MKASKSYIPKDTEISYIEESPTLYIVSKKATSLYEMTAFDKMQIVKKGVSKKYLESFKKATSLDYDHLAEALSVTRATLINKKGTDTFNDNISERIITLADLYAFGYEIFEDKEAFNQWMFTPNGALNNKQPFEIIDNYYGREEVRNIIGRIAYGVFS